jgi:hypothetical protein
MDDLNKRRRSRQIRNTCNGKINVTITDTRESDTTKSAIDTFVFKFQQQTDETKEDSNTGNTHTCLSQPKSEKANLAFYNKSLSVHVDFFQVKVLFETFQFCLND